MSSGIFSVVFVIEIKIETTFTIEKVGVDSQI